MFTPYLAYNSRGIVIGLDHLKDGVCHEQVVAGSSVKATYFL